MGGKVIRPSGRKDWYLHVCGRRYLRYVGSRETATGTAHQGMIELLRQVVQVDPPLVAFPGFSTLPLLPPLGIIMPIRGNIIPLQRGGIANGMIYILIILNSYWISIIVIFGYPFCNLLWSRRKPLLFEKRFSGYCRTGRITRSPTGSTGASTRVPATGATTTGTT